MSASPEVSALPDLNTRRKQQLARELIVKDLKITNEKIQEELRLMGFEKGIAPDYLASVRAELGVSGANARKKNRTMSAEGKEAVSKRMKAYWASQREAKKAPKKKTAKKKTAKKAKSSPLRARKAKAEAQTIVKTQTHIPADMLKHLKVVAAKMKAAGIFELTLDDKGNIKADVRKVMFLNIMQ
jgi:hypothetical protein